MPSAPFHRILVGWDASPAARHALTVAITIADGDGIVIAHAVLTPSPHTETHGGQTRDLKSQRDWLQEQFDTALLATGTHGARVRLEWGESDTIPEDLHACAHQHGCDLIVIGRHGGDSHLRTSGLGPVATSLVQSTLTPVLLVSPPAIETP
ncbi:universal stress protein [Streptomyces sp. NPDC046984]|uniref:universal stress protein n=1 Tax=Streptomyces sp. NPDC046984 TaxID=3155138 RepID=UPI0033E90D93